MNPGEITYAIDDGEGNLITAGLQESEASKVAQKIADERGEPVYLYKVYDFDYLHKVYDLEGEKDCMTEFCPSQKTPAEDDPRYWIDDNPLKQIFGIETRALVDEEAGGVIAYVCTEELAETLRKSLELEGS